MCLDTRGGKKRLDFLKMNKNRTKIPVCLFNLLFPVSEFLGIT